MDLEINRLIKFQSIIRRFISNKNNIFLKFKSEKIKQEFRNEIKGYHLINSSPIKESVWEEINRNIVRNECIITEEANGNHLSGKDNKFDCWTISNKTCKIEKNKNINISSYRLTTVCNDKSPGNKDNIIKEIEKRDNNFEYYSILLRKENKDSIIYYWCIVPKDYYIFNIKNYNLEAKIGKKGIKKDNIVGWKSKYCDITFSMSSQLWYHFKLNDIKKYIIDTIQIDIMCPKITYSQIYKLYNN